MSDAAQATSVASTDLIAVVQGSTIALATVDQINAAPSALIAALTARCVADEAAVVLLAQRVAVLEGKPDPCVALLGSLPVATLQVGSFDVPVAVIGLLSSDRVAVEAMSPVPSGLTLGAMRPHPTAAGILLVQATATLSLAGKSAIPLAVTALR